MSADAPLKKIARGAGLIFAGGIVSNFLSYLYRVFIARYFGPEDYGLFSLGLAIVGIAGAFALLGLSSGVTRYVAFFKAGEDYARVKGVITTALKIVLPASILLAAILIALDQTVAEAIFYKPELQAVLLILAFALPFNALNQVLISTFRGFQRVEYEIYAQNIFGNVVRVVTVVAFGLLGYGVAGIAASWAVASMATFLIAIYYLEKKVFPIFRTKIKSASIKRELLFFSLPLMFAGFVKVIMAWTDTVVLGYFRASSEVGLYNAALPTADVLNAVPAAITVLFLPVVSELLSSGKMKETEIAYRTVTKWIFYFNFPIFLLMVFFSRQVLNVLFGANYIPAYQALTILAAGYIISSLFVPAGQLLTAVKQTKIAMYIVLTAGFLNLALNIYLVPLLGIIGAAIATAFSLAFGGLLAGFFAWRFSGVVSISANFLKALAAGAIAAFVLNFASRLLFSSFTALILAALFVVFALLYGLLLLVFRGIEKEDAEILKAIERKSGLRIEFLRNFIKRFV